MHFVIGAGVGVLPVKLGMGSRVVGCLRMIRIDLLVIFMGMTLYRMQSLRSDVISHFC